MLDIDYPENILQKIDIQKYLWFTTIKIALDSDSDQINIRDDILIAIFDNVIYRSRYIYKMNDLIIIRGVTNNKIVKTILDDSERDNTKINNIVH